MIFEMFLALLLGIAAGIITGLTPGIHINLVAAILLGLAPLIALHVPLLFIAILIVAMSITHTFLDTIPSIFLGAPEEEMALGVLPGHRYLLRGNGLMAVKLCIVGGIFGMIASALLFAPAVLLLSLLYTVTAKVLFWIILAFVLFTTLKDPHRMWATLIFLLSGMLGIITLRLPLREPLLPMLSGLFGIATLLYSINEQQQLPEQKDLDHTELDGKKGVLGTLLGAAAGFLTALYPGMSASTTSALVARTKSLGDHGFLILLGSLGSASFLLSLAAYLAIAKARNGAMAVIVELAPINTPTSIALICAGLAACGVAALITLWLGRSAARWLTRIPYRATCIGVICFVVGIVIVRTGPIGALVLATSTAIGLLPAALKTARGQAMGCLLLPILVVLR